MLYLLSIIFVIVAIYAVFEFSKSNRREQLIERLNYGIDIDDENQSLWDGALNLLQLTEFRELIFKSSIIRNLDLLYRRTGLKFSFFNIIFLVLLVSVIVSAIMFAVFKTFTSSLIVFLLIPLFSYGILNFLSSRMQSRLDGQLPALISNFLTTINAGGTPIQALQSASKNANEPLKSSVTELLEKIQLGRSPVLAWQEWADFWGTKSSRLLATGIKIKWETGGQMSAILQHIQETLEFNRKMDLRVNTLTAQAKLSAWVLSALPIGLGFLTRAYRPDLFDVMLTDEFGKTLLYSAMFMTTFGFLWLRKISKLKN